MEGGGCFMEIIFIGAVGAMLFFTSLWKIVGPIFLIWWVAFIVFEHRQKTAEQKRFKISAPQMAGLKSPAHTVNYFGPVW
jgi:hypothetical protein